MHKMDLVALLHEHVVKVTFTKVDGTRRVMNCTLRGDLIPPVKESSVQGGETNDVNKPRAENVIAAWDTEANGWRSFRLDSVKEVMLFLEEGIVL
jgi:hypothetical protein